MTLEGDRLDTLVRECNKLVADKTYKSPECYAILSYMIQQLIKISGYRRYPMETKEQLELDAIIRCYTKIPRFNMQKATEARAKSGHAPDEGRSIHRYCQVIILTSFLTTLASLSRKRMDFVPIDIMGMGTSNTFVLLGNELTNKTDNVVKTDSTYELAYLKAEDIDAIIDAETVALRAARFEERLTHLERLTNG